MALKPHLNRSVPLPIIVAFAVLIAMVLGSLAIAVRLSDNTAEIAAISEYRRATTDVITAARDAEIGQRGYLLTGEPRYLEPYNSSISAIEPALRRMAELHGERGRTSAASLRPLVTSKIAELRETIAFYRSGNRPAALALVRTDRGKALMDQMRIIAERERAWGISQTNMITAEALVLARILTIGLIAGAIAVIVLSLAWLRQARIQYEAVQAARAESDTALMAFKTESDAREQAEGQVRQLQKMESLGALTGGIAHDFNNMLAVVLGGIELAKKRLRTDPDRADELLDNAREGATRAATLTARLLAFARNQPLAPAPLDLNKLLGGMCDMLHRTLGDSVKVECVYGAGLWRSYADPSEVENAILNLSVNARDAMPAGGELTIETANAHIDDTYARTRLDVAPGQYVQVSVTDNGTGMSQAVVERAFDPFFTTKPVGKGTGLGLSQVFGFIKQSGGHVVIYSEVGQGTTVKLYLPRFMGADQVQSPAVLPEAMPAGIPQEVILIVEDEARVRHFAVDALREIGYTAIGATSPAEALAILTRQPEVSLLFTDIVMPDMTGRQLADAALKLRPDLPILFTTGYTRNAVVHNGMIDVGVAFLAKPYGMGDLARKVRDVLDGRGANRTV